jgi:hypothetical protein
VTNKKGETMDWRAPSPATRSPAPRRTRWRARTRRASRSKVRPTSKRRSSASGSGSGWRGQSPFSYKSPAARSCADFPAHSLDARARSKRRTARAYDGRGIFVSKRGLSPRSGPELELQQPHEILCVGHDAERLVRASVLQLGDQELRLIDADRRDLTDRPSGPRRTWAACSPRRCCGARSPP